jgi:hypothetical protein
MIIAHSCGHEYQTMDHLLFHCVNSSVQREVVKQQVGTLPTAKQDSIFRYQKQFSAFVESTDFETFTKERPVTVTNHMIRKNVHSLEYGR